MMWMVRNPQGKHADELIKAKAVGIGWPGVVPFLKGAKNPEDFYNAIQKADPDLKGQEVVNAGRQLYKFFREMKDGDTVVTYDSPKRKYHVGTIAGAVRSDPEVEAPFSNVRAVIWQHEVDRDTLSQAARNSLGSTLTIFEPSEEAEQEIRKRIIEPDTSVPAETTPTAEVEAEDPFANAVENSRELIKDRLSKLSWEDMQSLVAGVLRAMGYKTKISAGGGDRGKDVVASPDGLGLEHPRIFVEVKHRKGQMGPAEIRQFIGGRHAQNDRCVFVSTGGFTTEAKYEAERSSVPLTLVDSDELVALLIDYYETTDAETRTLVPLRKTYWPV
jgi:restriction system protein